MTPVPPDIAGRPAKASPGLGRAALATSEFATMMSDLATIKDGPPAGRKAVTLMRGAAAPAGDGTGASAAATATTPTATTPAATRSLFTGAAQPSVLNTQGSSAQAPAAAGTKDANDGASERPKTAMSGTRTALARADGTAEPMAHTSATGGATAGATAKNPGRAANAPHSAPVGLARGPAAAEEGHTTKVSARPTTPPTTSAQSLANSPAEAVPAGAAAGLAIPGSRPAPNADPGAPTVVDAPARPLTAGSALGSPIAAAPQANKPGPTQIHPHAPSRGTDQGGGTQLQGTAAEVVGKLLAGKKGAADPGRSRAPVMLDARGAPIQTTPTQTLAPVPSGDIKVTRQETHFAPVRRPEAVEAHRWQQQLGETIEPTRDEPKKTPFSAIADQVRTAIERAGDPEAKLPQQAGHQQQPGARPLAPLRIVELSLQPAALGALSVTMRLSGTGLRITVNATSRETAELLGEEQEALSALLASAGYEASEIVIAYRPDNTV
ncbi:MAG: flagellar hook-length control protein FliK [Pseudomonadota bacterium]